MKYEVLIEGVGNLPGTRYVSGHRTLGKAYESVHRTRRDYRHRRDTIIIRDGRRVVERFGAYMEPSRDILLGWHGPATNEHEEAKREAACPTT